VDTLTRDIRDGLRQWRRAPLMTAVALASLGLGIGANLALFSLVAAVHFTPLPVRAPERLARIVTDRGEYALQNIVWEYVRREQAIFEGVAGAAAARLNLASDGESRFSQALYVTGEFFDVIGVPMARGRGLTPADDRAGAAPVAVISHAFWQRELGAREDAVGRTVDVERERITIVGVTAPAVFGIEVGRRTDLYLPAAVEPLLAGAESRASHPAVHWLQMFGRLHQDQTTAQATAALRGWQPALREATIPPETPARQHLSDPLEVVSASTGVSFLRRDFGRPLLLLLGAVGLVLLVACANLAALVLARFTDRQRELVVRRALGASRVQLVRSLMTETLLLGVTGAALGMALAVWLTELMVPWLASPLDRGIVPHLAVGLDWRLVSAAAALALATSLAAGLAPAIAAARVAPLGALTSASRGSSAGRGPARTLRLLVAVQIALSLVLVSAAALLARSFVALTSQPTAVDGDRVLLASLNGPLFAEHPLETQARIDELLRRLEAIPGVDAASASTLTPLSGIIMLTPVTASGFASDDPRDANAAANRITPRFLEVFGTRLLAGRPFDERDGPDAPRVAIVNTAFVERYLPDLESAVGQVVQLRGRDTEIVGVVATGRYMNVREPERRFVYVPLAQFLGPQPQPVRFAVRSAMPDALRGPVVQAVRAFDPALTVEFRTLADEIATSSNRERLLAWLGSLFAVLALTMAAIGLYGAFAYMVARRRLEFGIRVALGADRLAILRLVLCDAAIVLVAGAAVGLAAAVASGRFLEALLFDVQPRDPAMLALALLVVTLVAAVSSYLPARTAAAANPAEGLRAE
jgi:putative ABC transport system permease protein